MSIWAANHRNRQKEQCQDKDRVQRGDREMKKAQEASL